MRGTLGTTIGRAFHRTRVPLAFYYAVTLALPLANGAAQAGEAFATHALVVLVIPPIAIVLVCAMGALVRAFRTRVLSHTVGPCGPPSLRA
jgi:hypothetical protein